RPMTPGSVACPRASLTKASRTAARAGAGLTSRRISASLRMRTSIRPPASLLPRLLDHALHGHSARLRALRFPRLQVVAIPGREQVELPAGVDPPRVVVDGHVAGADHVEVVAAHHDRGVLVETDAQEVGMALDHGDEVELAVAL